MPPSLIRRQHLFKDHFSHDSDSYSRHRPGYPEALFSYLSSIANNHNLAWDCATGSGQSAVQLAQYFNRIIATDASQSQIGSAQQHERIGYVVASAENSALDDNCLDLISVAQALHWFDLGAFTDEVDRTLKEGGILAVWSYNLLTIRADIDEQVNDLYRSVLNKYWPAERRLVEQGYESIDFPYHEITTPNFSMALGWNFGQLIDYLSTWSAIKAYISDNGKNPIEIIHDRLLKLWGSPDTRMPVKWPLTVRIWQKS